MADIEHEEECSHALHPPFPRTCVPATAPSRRGGGRIRPHRFWSLLAASVCAGLLVVHDAGPAAADHGAGTTVWTATLTVEDLGGARYGCNHTSSGDECTSALTDDDFNYEGTDYSITGVAVTIDDEPHGGL